MEDKETFIEKFKITDCDCDWKMNLMPGSFLRMAQQIATDHCSSLGMDEAFYKKEGAVFLLARMTLHFDRVPKAGEILTVTTLPEIMHRALYKRITVAKDENGKQVAVADSRWILVNVETKKILRHPTEGFEKLPFAENVPFDLDAKIKAPEILEPCGKVRAVYSRCDQNRHMNNTRYADVAADALPMEELMHKKITDMVIHYHKELPAGETAELYRAKNENGKWYVCGLRDERQCFEAEMELH